MGKNQLQKARLAVGKQYFGIDFEFTNGAVKIRHMTLFSANFLYIAPLISFSILEMMG